MADNLLFNIDLYDEGDNFQQGEDWKRYSSAYCVASSLEKATKIAKDNVGENEIVVGIRELVDTKFFYEKN
jgi:hypothetical protein